MDYQLTDVIIREAFTKTGVDMKYFPVYETESEIINFLRGKGKICIVKHSMFEKLGKDAMTIRILEEISMNEGVKVGLVIDEAHKIQNPDGVAQQAYHRVDFLFDRVIMLTATPYSSCLSQFWGLVCIIHPEIWPTKKSFFNRYIDEIAIRDPDTHRVIRKEKVRYKNLREFRSIIEPFTYFYYPKIALVHVEHHTRLADYTEYDTLCKGLELKDEKKQKE